MRWGVVAQQGGTQNPTNLLLNGDFENWGSGAALAPDGWALAGAGASVAREASTIKLGTYSAKLTRSGTNCNIHQHVDVAKGIAYWKGRKITLGCWIWCAAASTARLDVDDGVTDNYSAYHTGDSTWQWITVTITVGSSATTIQCSLQVLTDTSAYFDGAMCTEGSGVFAYSPAPPPDYETGTWTPAVKFGTGNTGITYGSQVGTFTRIGNMAFINGYIGLSSKGSSTGSISVTGLPYTIYNSPTQRGCVYVWGYNLTYSGFILGYPTEGDTVFGISQITEAGTAGALTDANATNTTVLGFHCMYRIA